MDQDETWHAGRPRPWPHRVRWGPSSRSPKWAQPPIFGPYLLRQMAAWIKMLLGMELGLCPGDFVLDGDPAHPSPPKRGVELSKLANLANFQLLVHRNSHHSSCFAAVCTVLQHGHTWCHMHMML